MTGMKSYYVSRAIISIAFGVLFATGSTWWTGILVGTLAFAWFLLAPHIGRYSVHPEFGITALRRDEHTQVINDKAARNAFVISMLALGGIICFDQCANRCFQMAFNPQRVDLLSIRFLAEKSTFITSKENQHLPVF
jgi:hypothetical protein